MIERDYNLYILVCDVCGEEQTYNDFQEAVEAKKKEGWQSKREKGQWLDICPCCLGMEQVKSINNCKVIKKYKKTIGEPIYYDGNGIIYCQGYVKSFVNDEPIDECMYCPIQVDNPERFEVENDNKQQS